MLTPKDEYTGKVEAWGAKWIETPLDGTGINPIQDMKYLLLLKKVFKREKPDVALCYTIKANIYACLASRSTSIPVICNVSGLGTVFLVEGLTGKIAMALYRIAFRNAGFVFFQNEDDKNLFTSKIEVKKEKLGLLAGSGIDLSGFEYTAPHFSKRTKFLMISRLIIEKGVKEYAEAASFFVDNENVEFTLVGRLDESHSRSIAKNDLDDWINKGWINYLSHSDKIKELIKEHEVIVLPSYREGTPRTLLEGAAMGRALLASDVPGCKEVVIDGENGFLFKVKDAKSLVNKVKLYLSLRMEERTKLSIASRKLAEEKYDEKHIISSYQNVIQQMTSPT